MSPKAPGGIEIRLAALEAWRESEEMKEMNAAVKLHTKYWDRFMVIGSVVMVLGGGAWAFTSSIMLDEIRATRAAVAHAASPTPVKTVP